MAASAAICTPLLAAEPAQNIVFGQARAMRSTGGEAHLTFPATTSAPLRWKTPASSTIRPVAHIDDVNHTTDDLEPAEEVTEHRPAEIVRPAAFTLQLDAPRNTSHVRTVGNDSTDDIKSSGSRSVLSARRPGQARPAPNDPAKDPFNDHAAQNNAPVRPAPSMLGSPRVESRPPVEQQREVMEESAEDGDTLLLDSAGPPQPEEDADDPAPVAPRSLRPLPQRPSDTAFLQDEDVAPRSRRRGQPGCDKPNDRDCCDDEGMCLEQLDRLRKDGLRFFDKGRLDITPAYKPDADTPEEIEAARERLKQQLKLAGEREWKDRHGKPLVHGQLVELQLGKAHIRNDANELVEVKLRLLSDDDLCFIAAWYNLPTECTLGAEQFAERQFVATSMTWKASGLCHKPLYFEEVQLERYGHSAGPIAQPVLSGAHFVLNIMILPYKMGINPPQECQYALGYYRPGSCAPWMIPPVPLSARGAASAAGFYLGGAALLP